MLFIYILHSFVFLFSILNFFSKVSPSFLYPSSVVPSQLLNSSIWFLFLLPFSFSISISLFLIFSSSCVSSQSYLSLLSISESESHSVVCPTLWVCPTLCDPVDCSPPGSSIHGILQARILEWFAISFSRGSSWPRDRTQVSCIAGRCFNLWATRGWFCIGLILSGPTTLVPSDMIRPRYLTDCWQSWAFSLEGM